MLSALVAVEAARIVLTRHPLIIDLSVPEPGPVHSQDLLARLAGSARALATAIEQIEHTVVAIEARNKGGG